MAAASGPGFRMPRLDAEIAGLPGSFAPGTGALLIALAGGEAAGCVAWRPLTAAGACEIKRLWVEPASRGRGLGEALVRAVCADAAAAGMVRASLDTEPAAMAAAHALYLRLGFRAAPPPPGADPGLAALARDLPLAGPDAA
jgi:ribosomal protein S18 acetylase RimI-like enzyme